jgi:hypothetical protein
MVMDEIEWEAIQLENEMQQKYFKSNLPDPKLLDFKLDFGNFLTSESDIYSTHSKQLEGEELKAYQKENKRRDEYYSDLLLARQKEKEKNKKKDMDEDLDEEDKDFKGKKNYYFNF